MAPDPIAAPPTHNTADKTTQRHKISNDKPIFYNLKQPAGNIFGHQDTDNGLVP